jgi:hypothetical protein
MLQTSSTDIAFAEILRAWREISPGEEEKIDAVAIQRDTVSRSTFHSGNLNFLSFVLSHRHEEGC